MSGIFGFVTYNNIQNDNPIDISLMMLWNRVFGKDNEACYKHSGISMGCCIEYLFNKHIQQNPVLDYLGNHAVIDAILYNRTELIEKCDAEGDISDAELLFRYVIKFGPDSLKDVNGDFSGAIINDKSKSLILFRDHMGIRPLFYYEDGGFVAFSTDIRGLISLPQVDASISEDWIYKTISGYIADTIDNTPYENIFCVTPASYLVFSYENGRLKKVKNRYWKLRQKKVKLSDEKNYQNTLRELINDALIRRLDTISGPVGAELSGGMDSGVIDILINRAGREGIFYSWSFDPKELELTKDDERRVIEDICKQEKIVCNYSHKSSDYGPEVEKRMGQIGIGEFTDDSYDFRYAFPSWTNTYSLIIGAQFVAKRGASVMFTGHGGDEGVSHRCSPYEMYHYHEYYRYFRYIWAATSGHKHRIRTSIFTSIKHIKGKKKERKKPYISGNASPELLNQTFKTGKTVEDAISLHFDHDPIEYIEMGGARNRLDNIALYGALSGVRYMVPYLDYRVIDFAVSIPRYLYLRGKYKRYIFREAFKDIMPESLYKSEMKEDTSFRNIETDPDWYDSYAKRKAEIINKLKREYWKKYLNFDIIDKLAKAGKPTDEEYEVEARQLTCLLNCALAQNLVEKARNITT